MIIAERKGLDRIIEMLDGRRSILVAGCRSCVSVCQAGGEREVVALAEALRLHAASKGMDRSIDTVSLERQCEKVLVQEIEQSFEGKDTESTRRDAAAVASACST